MQDVASALDADETPSGRPVTTEADKNTVTHEEPDASDEGDDMPSTSRLTLSPWTSQGRLLGAAGQWTLHASTCRPMGGRRAGIERK